MEYNIELQSNNVELQEILDTINTLPEASGKSVFPYSITVNTSGIDGCQPKIYYSDDMTSVFIATCVNNQSFYTRNISVENASWSHQQHLDFAGDFLILYNITGDVIVDIIWTISGDY